MNNAMASAAESQLIAAAQIIEDQLDAEINKLEQLDEDDMDIIRERRMQKMKQEAIQKQEWIHKGHGDYSEITTEGEFFEVHKQSSRVICHFYRSTTARCAIVDKHLDIIAKKHLEAKCIKMNVEKSPFLVERLSIKVLPTIVMITDGVIKDRVVGFDDVGGTDEFCTEALEWRLSLSGVITYTGEPYDPTTGKKNKFSIVNHSGLKKSIRGGAGDDSDSDSD